jgi:hypothetical protein
MDKGLVSEENGDIRLKNYLGNNTLTYDRQIVRIPKKTRYAILFWVRLESIEIDVIDSGIVKWLGSNTISKYIDDNYIYFHYFNGNTALVLSTESPTVIPTPLPSTAISI